MTTVTRQAIQGGIERMQQQIDSLKDFDLQVGWFEGAKYDADTSVAGVAAQNELGNPAQNIPPRPFMRPAIAENKAKWSKFIGRQVLRILNNQTDVKTTLEGLGLNVAGEIRKAITQVHNPALSEKTVKARVKIRAKKNITGTLRKPLVFEGVLLNSLAYVVKGGSEIYPYGKKEPDEG